MLNGKHEVTMPGDGLRYSHSTNDCPLVWPLTLDSRPLTRRYTAPLRRINQYRPIKAATATSGAITTTGRDTSAAGG